MEFIGHTAKVDNVAFNHKGDQLVSSDVNGKIVIWNAITCKMIKEFLSDYGIRYISFNHTDKKIIGYNKTEFTCKIWVYDMDIDSLCTIKFNDYKIFSIAASPINDIIYLCCSDNVVRSLDIEKLEVKIYFNTKADKVRISPDGLLIAIHGYNGIMILNVSTKVLIQRLGWGIRHFAFSQNSAKIIGATVHALITWNLIDKNTVYHNYNSENVTHVLFGMNDTVNITVIENSIMIYDIKTEEFIRRIEHSSDIWNIAVSPDGRCIASCSDNNILLHRIKNGYNTKPAMRCFDDLVDKTSSSQIHDE